METLAQKRARAAKMVSILKRAYPNAKCSLDYKTPLQLLIATILSAQCTDARVNMVTPALFAKYKTASDFASAKPSELESLVRSTGFYKNKAKNIKEACRLIVSNYDGKVPRTMAELIALPGVGRKTASIVLGNAFGIIEGVPVDTHAIRLSHRFGWTKQTAQEKIERDLMALLPRSDWVKISDLFVHHGRAVCSARKPMCSKCPIEKLCHKIGVEKK
jgi:endonuclease-3